MKRPNTIRLQMQVDLPVPVKDFVDASYWFTQWVQDEFGERATDVVFSSRPDEPNFFEFTLTINDDI